MGTGGILLPGVKQSEHEADHLPVLLVLRFGGAIPPLNVPSRRTWTFLPSGLLPDYHKLGTRTVLRQAFCIAELENIICWPPPSGIVTDVL
jgi:hypothetical protein